MSWALIAGAGIAAVGEIGGSVFQNSALRQQGSGLVHQADIMLQEAKREAALIIEDGEKFAANQSLQYIGAGFELGASAVLTMNETKKRAKDEADSLVNRAQAEYSLAEKQRATLKKQGKAGIISSMFSGAGTLIGATSKG